MTYSIGDVSKITGISPSAIRFYEEKQLLFPISRKPSGVRHFSDDDIERLTFITELKKAGLSINEIHQCFHFCDMGDDTIGDRINLYKKHKEKILTKMKELENCIEHIDEKIAYLNKKKNDNSLFHHANSKTNCVNNR